MNPINSYVTLIDHLKFSPYETVFTGMGAEAGNG